ncbi:MAG TPA: MFS transporter, partial [Phycisphaerales bacterium]|nr:MFS transporter [Phycisphaerales bacterium]
MDASTPSPGDSPRSTDRPGDPATVPTAAPGSGPRSVPGAGLACIRCRALIDGFSSADACPKCSYPIERSLAGLLPDGRRHRWGVLRHRHFRNVWIGSFGASLGGWMEHVGVRWMMTRITTRPEWDGPDATVMIAQLTTAALLPSLLLGMVGGLVADRVNRKTMLIYSRVLMMLIAVALAAASWTGHATPAALLVLSALQGVVIAFDIPAYQVLIPRLVPRDELTLAVHLNGVQFNLARVIGPALGGAVLAWTGATWLFVINALSFLGVLLPMAFTPDSPAPPRRPGGRGVIRQAWADVAEAMSFVFHNRGPRAVFLALVIFAIFATPLMQFLPVIVSQVYGKNETIFGVMLGVMGAGAVVGGLVVRRVPRWYPMHHFIPLSVLLGGVSIGLFAAMDRAVPAAVFLFLSGVFWLWAFSATTAAMQLLVDDAMRGRVLAVCNTMALGLMPVGTVLGGWAGRLVAGEGDTGGAAQIA